MPKTQTSPRFLKGARRVRRCTCIALHHAEDLATDGGVAFLEDAIAIANLLEHPVLRKPLERLLH